MRSLLAIVIVLLAAAHARAGEGCTCRATDGSDVAEGATACLKSPGGMTLARCEKVLNNTSWKFLDQPCPQARMSPASPLALPRNPKG